MCCLRRKRKRYQAVWLAFAKRRTARDQNAPVVGNWFGITLDLKNRKMEK